MFRLYIIYIDHILPALILLCPSKPMACSADRPFFSFIRLQMGKGHQGEPHQTVNQNHCTQRYMWKTPRTGEMNPTYREKSFQMVISKSFPFFLVRRWKKPLWWCCRCHFIKFFFLILLGVISLTRLHCTYVHWGGLGHMHSLVRDIQNIVPHRLIGHSGSHATCL